MKIKDWNKQYPEYVQDFAGRWIILPHAPIEKGKR